MSENGGLGKNRDKIRWKIRPPPNENQYDIWILHLALVKNKGRCRVLGSKCSNCLAEKSWRKYVDIVNGQQQKNEINFLSSHVCFRKCTILQLFVV